MLSIHQRFETVFRWYRACAVTLLLIGCLGELLTLLTRNIFRVQPDWTVEVNTLSLVFGSLLFVGEAQSHIAFRGFADAASRRLPWMRNFSVLISGIVMGVLAVLGLQVVSQEWATHAGTAVSLNIPLWAIYSVIPVTALCGVLRSIQSLLENKPI